MSNLINNQFNSLRFEINYKDYWDFFINREPLDIYSGSFNGSSLYDKCLVSYIDTTDDLCIEGNDLVSKQNYTWDNATVIPYTLFNVGYTGVDNGLIPFKRDRVTNREFLEIYQHSTYDITEDNRVRLHPVDGGTNLYDYPVSTEDKTLRLNGGFYQGFFMTDCDKYSVLPYKLDNGDVWHFEFLINKIEFDKESNKTLNDKYPNNKGIFFYIGTRAENKWAYLYDWDEIMTDTSRSECFVNPNIEWEDWRESATDDYLSYKHYNDKLYNTEETDWYNYTSYVEEASMIDETTKHNVVTWGKNHVSYDDIFDLVDDDSFVNPFDYLEQDLDIKDFEFKTDSGLILGKNVQTVLETDNKFLMFDRTCNGYTVDDYNEGDIVRYVSDKNNFKGNLFLLMDRTCNGYTTDTIDDLKDAFKSEYNVVSDLINNALAFRITDDNRIGYRYITSNCDLDDDKEYKIIEGYSKENTIPEEEWCVINVCVKGFMNTMALEFYVNGRLVFLTNEMPKLNLRKLNDLDEKQETVAYNISLGGGTQGLCDTILPNYMLDPYRVYPLEENFGGSFIGYIRKFRFYNCRMSFNNILNNYRFEMCTN